MLTRTALSNARCVKVVPARRSVIARFNEKPKEHPSSYCGGTSSITLDEGEYEDQEVKAALASIKTIPKKSPKLQSTKVDSSVFQYPGMPCGGTTSLSVDEEDGYNRMVIEAAEKAVEALKDKQDHLANSIIDTAHAVRFVAHAADTVPHVPKRTVVPTEHDVQIDAADVLRLEGH